MWKYLVIAGSVLLAGNLHAGKTTVLESFETDINAASPAAKSGQPVSGIALSQYIRTDAADTNVTDGSKSLKVVLGRKGGFGDDFAVKLSEEASAKIREAAAAKDVARYILRYDVVFPPMTDVEYFNSALYLGDSRDVLLSTGGKRTMSVALDLLTGLPAKGPLTLMFAEDFGFKTAQSNAVIYVDNIRLVDTYATGVKPQTYIIQSFEDKSNPTGGAENFTEWDKDKPIIRTAFSQYTAAAPGDVRVSDGQHALEVSNSHPEIWHADFTLPFNNTKLAEVLKLDESAYSRPTPEQLSRYTFRFDVTYPDLTNDWMNSTFHTMESFMPIIQFRHAKPNSQRQTYSITLDQVSWGSWNNVAPILMFITQGPLKSSNTKVYYDNFRLIDTGEDLSVKAAAVVAHETAGDSKAGL